MKILFLLSCLEPAGSEMYCTALAEAWRGKHEIFWISDQLHNDQIYTSMPIHGKAIPFGLINTWRVASYIRKNKIQLVHSHSRRAHWVAAQAARLTGIAHVTTIHQPLPLHFFSRLFPCLGHQSIAIDEVVYDHLRTLYGQPADQVQLVRNGINLTSNLPSVRQIPKVKQILIIGRLSGGRWRAFQFFLKNLERLAKSLPTANYKIVGQIPNERRAGLVDQLSILGSHLAPGTIEMLGFVKDLPNLIRNSDAAVAAGRSAMECLAQSRPVLLLGEGGVLGYCRPDIWPTALRTNLGDHLEPNNFSSNTFEAGLRELLAPRPDPYEMNHWARSQMEKYFDIRRVAPQVEAVYHMALTRAQKSSPSR